MNTTETIIKKFNFLKQLSLINRDLILPDDQLTIDLVNNEVNKLKIDNITRAFELKKFTTHLYSTDFKLNVVELKEFITLSILDLALEINNLLKVKE
jgi:hypothetical protein